MLVRQIADRLQLDKPLAYAMAARIWQSVSGPITIVFLVRSLSLSEQGIYYSLVSILGTSRQSDRDNHAPGNLMDIRERVTSYSGFAIFNGDLFSLGEPGQPAERVLAMNIAANFLDRKNGGWHEELTEDLQPAHTIFAGKGDIYHALQACLIPLYPAEGSVTKGIIDSQET